MANLKSWQPPEFVDRERCIKDTEEVLGQPDLPIKSTEDIFRINVLGMDWDLGMVVHEPVDANKIPTGADGKKAGFFLLHGGSGDFKGIERHAKLLASKLGFRVIAGTFPGRFYFPDPSRDWPDDTIHADGTVRTPIWKQDELITPDQYEVVKDPSKRNRYGTRTVARAKPETNFWYRMAAWPAAFEEGMIEACRRHFPEKEFSIYGQGHSTGGPFVCMLSQRIPNMAGVCATEHSPFGYLCCDRDKWGGDMGKISGYEKVEKKGKGRTDPFNELYIRTWRDLARYQGPEALGQEGPTALMRLPAITRKSNLLASNFACLSMPLKSLEPPCSKKKPAFLPSAPVGMRPASTGSCTTMPRSQSIPKTLIRNISSVLFIGRSGMPRTSSVSLMHWSRATNSDGCQLEFKLAIFVLLAFVLLSDEKACQQFCGKFRVSRLELSINSRR